MPRHAAPTQRRPGDLLVRTGAAVFAVALVAVVVCVVTFLAGAQPPLWLVVSASALPVGAGLALLGLLRQVLARPAD